ncbi:MAG: 2-hydroxyacid dehydrogenase, partial [Planctomycetota bacterium]|nr:2-hydroxyacid dehydrogenase [Planctomycetota bacterium]
MRVLVTSTKPYDRRFLEAAAAGSDHQLDFTEAALRPETAILARDHDAVCVFVNDHCDAPVLNQLAAVGVRAVALRCAGFNNVDLDRAGQLGIAVVRVPAYSP